MKRKVLLVSPGYYESGDYGYALQPPMGLFKIARYFKNKGVEVEYLDCQLPPRIADTNINTKNHFIDAPFVKYLPCGNFEQEGILKPQRYFGIPHRVIREKIRAAKPTEIWVSTGLTYYWESVQEVVTICKEVFPTVPVFIGGIYASLYPQHASKMVAADYIHVGALEDIDGLMPDYDIDPSKKSIRTIQISKGCNVNPPCSFCAVVSLDPKFSPLNEDNVFNYIQEEYKKGARYWQLWASQLLVPPRRFIGLLDKIIGSDINIKLIASEGVQPSLFSQEISDKMYKAGFTAVSIPMESIQEDLVLNWAKPSTFKDYTQAVTNAQRSGFKVVKSFILAGLPGQTYDEIIHGIVDCWARDTVVAYHQYTPVPAAPDWYHEDHKKYHGQSPELLHPSLWPGAHAGLKVEYLEEIKKVLKIGFRGFVKFKDSKVVKVREIWDLYLKWCKMYELIRNGKPVDTLPLAYQGYTSLVTDNWKNNVHSRETNPEAYSESFCRTS